MRIKRMAALQIYLTCVLARLAYVGTPFWYAARGFLADKCLSMGAGIAFFMVLSTIPLLLVGTSALGFFLGSSKEAFFQMVAAFKQFFPRTTVMEVEGLFRSIIEKKSVAGGVGLVFLLWGGIAVFATIEDGLNTILGTSRAGSFFRRQLWTFLMMLGTGILLLIALGMTWIPFAFNFLDVALESRLSLRTTPVWNVAIFAFPMFLMTFLFAFLYKMASPKFVAFKEALIGGLVASIIWRLAKMAFNWYFLYSLEWYKNIYGLLGGFIAILLWIYYTSLLLLFGAEVTKALQNKRFRV